MNKLITSHKFLTPGVMVAQSNIDFAESLIEEVKTQEKDRDYRVVHENQNIRWHEQAGKDYHVTFIDRNAPELLPYDNHIAMLVTESIRIFNSQFHSEGLNLDLGYNILHYVEGGEYPWHYDGVGNKVEAFFILNLNDDFEGGLLEFSQFDFTIPAKKGQIIIAPTGITFEHRSTKITSGEKFIVRSRLTKRKQGDE